MADLATQTVISASSAVIGAGIGKITGNTINPYATTFTNSVALGNVAEIATDMTLSLGADYLMVKPVNFTNLPTSASLASLIVIST